MTVCRLLLFLLHQAHHQEILSQQQDLIMATQSAQAVLDKQANMLTPEEKDKLQKSIQELKGRYDASLTQAEQQMKQVQCIQEELKKFRSDVEDFDGWLDQAERDMGDLGAPGDSLDDLSAKLLRQKSFSEDVISHKGDLRFITMSGQKVLDVATACGLVDPVEKNAQLHVDTSKTCAAVKEQLDSAASRYKMLHSQVLNQKLNVVALLGRSTPISPTDGGICIDIVLSRVSKINSLISVQSAR